MTWVGSLWGLPPPLPLEWPFKVFFALTPMAGVELSCPCSQCWLSCLSRLSSFFLSFRALSLEVSAFSQRGGAWAFNFWGLELFLSVSLGSLAGSSVLVGRWPQEQQLFIFFIRDWGWQAALASASMAFLITSSQVSRSQPRSSVWAWMEGFRPSQK